VTGFFVHQGIIPAVNRVEFVLDTMLRGTIGNEDSNDNGVRVVKFATQNM
jgi:hypothetical protein